MENKSNNIYSQKDQKKIDVYRALVDKCKRQDWGYLKIDNEWKLTTGMVCSFGMIEFGKTVGIKRPTLQYIMKVLESSGIITRKNEHDESIQLGNGRFTSVKYSIVYINTMFTSDDELLNHIKLHLRNAGNPRFNTTFHPDEKDACTKQDEKHIDTSFHPDEKSYSIENNVVSSIFMDEKERSDFSSSSNHDVILNMDEKLGQACFSSAPPNTSHTTLPDFTGSVTASLTDTQILLTTSTGSAIIDTSDSQCNSILIKHLIDDMMDMEQLDDICDHIKQRMSHVATEKRQQKRATSALKRRYNSDETPDETIERLKSTPAATVLMDKVESVTRKITNTRPYKDMVIEAANEQRIIEQTKKGKS